ncbi:aldo/keto reductase [Conexibacter sp. CPCC 206217]|uniref:aldo/keto reductase n=1 Tax=Conexibacter sp. CPCC 206217 TaxID=3064574 RepID=UPI00271C8E16|nr:aldo/keto reductase [Conexibacter sp. CPCC 206217]MDO8213136.1 aldo/keto reductase [Conexibacter sp. CPCC 206217]
MDRVTLTADGPEVSVLGIGCNNFGHNPFGTFLDYSESRAVVDAALAAGVTAFDTADVYAEGESEEHLGRALQGHRDGVVIATKWGYPMPAAPAVPHGREEYVRWALEGSLRRLRTDRVDLFVLHRADPETPIDETLGVVAELVAEGKVGRFGTSMSSVTELEAAAAARTARPELPAVATCMFHYNLLHRDPDADVVPACARLGVTVLPFFPLENGLLTGKYARASVEEGRLREQLADVGDATWTRLDALRAFADERGATLLQVALGGLARLPGVGPIFAGATRPEQVTANAAAIAWRPSEEDLAELGRLTLLRGTGE